MKKVSAKKLSILGLVLLAASAVTAAVLPKDEKSSAKFDASPDGTRTISSAGLGDNLTCAPRNNGQVNTCNMTENDAQPNTETTGIGVNSDNVTTA